MRVCHRPPPNTKSFATHAQGRSSPSLPCGASSVRALLRSQAVARAVQKADSRKERLRFFGNLWDRFEKTRGKTILGKSISSTYTTLYCVDFGHHAGRPKIEQTVQKSTAFSCFSGFFFVCLVGSLSIAGKSRECLQRWMVGEDAAGEIWEASQMR